MTDLVDYVVDAHSDGIVGLLPRTQSMAWRPESVRAVDGPGLERRIRVQCDGAGRYRLCDDARNVRTGFRDSRRGVELAARTLFRHDQAATRDPKPAAIATAFDAAGIVA
ncbi:hypothetical protein ACFYOT_10965 [Saccharothrix saharensis]|uniref:hypothetical protein n=1 Tax=Saccharothrix saharensis TaxID=571190 RepID=UPI00369EE0CD